MKSFCSLLVLAFSLPLAAVETDPNKMKLLQCMTLFEFEFVADELGFGITQVDKDGKDVPPPNDDTAARIRADQATKFAETGKLTPRAPMKKKPTKAEKELELRCHYIADAVIESMVLKHQLEGGESRPRLLEQSL